MRSVSTPESCPKFEPARRIRPQRSSRHPAGFGLPGDRTGATSTDSPGFPARGGGVERDCRSVRLNQLVPAVLTASASVALVPGAGGARVVGLGTGVAEVAPMVGGRVGTVYCVD